jgi:ribonuclease P protein component
MKPASLRGRILFERVSRKGKRFGSGYLQLRVLKNNLGFNRTGFVIPKKAVRLAVDRNRIRRLLKESFRTMAHEIEPGFDIVVFVRRVPDINRMRYVQDTLVDLLRKSNLIKQTSAI